MPKNPTDPAPDAPEDLTGQSDAYEVPEDLAATVADDGGSDEPARAGAVGSGATFLPVLPPAPA